MARKQKLDIFSRFTTKVSSILGHAWVFVTALLVLTLWAASGPVFHFTTTWQLLINTTTTIVTFLMVFIIQNTQNRDNLAINVKLDAIMRKLGITEEELIDAEEQSDKVLERELKEERAELRFTRYEQKHQDVGGTDRSGIAEADAGSEGGLEKGKEK